MEQRALDNFIKIIGVQETQDENNVETVKTVIKKLGVKTTVNRAFRVPSKIKKKPRKLVAELSTHQCSSNTISNSRKTKPKRNMFHEKWGMELTYVNNYLTFFNRNLLFKTLLLAKPDINLFGLRTRKYIFKKMKTKKQF